MLLDKRQGVAMGGLIAVTFGPDDSCELAMKSPCQRLLDASHHREQREGGVQVRPCT